MVSINLGTLMAACCERPDCPSFLLRPQAAGWSALPAQSGFFNIYRYLIEKSKEKKKYYRGNTVKDERRCAFAAQK
jgi:hypothetical protein